MRRWFVPVLVGLVLAVVVWQAALTVFPGQLMSLAVKRISGTGGFNTFAHGALATDKARAIVRPSPDLAYSSCPFDLSKGPVLIEATPVAAPYWSLSVFDAQTNAVFVRNDHDGQHKPVKLALARPGQNVPAGVETLRLDGDKGIALIRILVESRDAFPAIDTARRAARCGPLG